MYYEPRRPYIVWYLGFRNAHVFLQKRRGSEISQNVLSANELPRWLVDSLGARVRCEPDRFHRYHKLVPHFKSGSTRKNAQMLGGILFHFMNETTQEKKKKKQHWCGWHNNG